MEISRTRLELRPDTYKKQNLIWQEIGMVSQQHLIKEMSERRKTNLRKIDAE